MPKVAKRILHQNGRTNKEANFCEVSKDKGWINTSSVNAESKFRMEYHTCFNNNNKKYKGEWYDEEINNERKN
jgi:hypothetical protein